jgi:hypothetical protein
MATTTNYGWDTPDDTDLVKDGAAAIRTLGSSIDTTTKNLNPSTTLGDIEYRSATANTNTRLAIGSTGNVLTVSGGVPVWAAPAGGGKVLQVVYADTTTATLITTATYTDSTLSASITPSSASSKVLVMVSQQAYQYTNGNEALKSGIKIVRGATDIWTSTTDMIGSNDNNDNDPELYGQWSLIYLDSPNTTSATTYKTQGRPATATNGNRIEFQKNSARSSIILMEIGA